jgi:virginiamycin B lyase
MKKHWRAVRAGSVPRGGLVFRLGMSVLALVLALALGPVSITASANSTAGHIKFWDRFLGINYPRGIVAGPDGALWFTMGYANSIGRITTAGVFTSYYDPASNTPDEIAAGPDGALWFTNEGDSIGRITTAGVITDYIDTSICPYGGITAGPDGAMWFANACNGSIGRITTAGVVTTYTGVDHYTQRITAGPDGALWFTSGGSIGRITTAGVITHYTGAGISLPAGITTGPDGALWFTNYYNNTIGRITTAGVVTNYAGTGLDGPLAIATGPDGALWFTNANGISIGRITTAGVFTSYSDVGPNGSGTFHTTDIATGPDGALWFTDQGNSSIGRITTAVTPHIGGHSPLAGPVGTTVTVTGRNLAGATAVAFNGVPATIVSDSGRQIVTIVPAGATTGYLTVTTAAGTATSVHSFTVT